MITFRSYPPSVFFILGNEFCERFSFYGMKALLTVYLVTEHHFIPSVAVLLYHLFSCLAYLSPIAGSILADSFFGRYKVILYVSILYVCGHALLSFGAIPWLEYYYRSFFDFSGLFVIALATGGIKPCVSAFAVDQFPEGQNDKRAQFFSFFYFSINGGALLAILITPIFKSRISCFSSDHCFPLAFGVPGILMLIALIIFMSGSRFYKKLPPSGSNMGFKLIDCIWTALNNRIRGETIRDGEDWIDLASSKYLKDDIDAVRSFINVCIVFSPIIFFWALFDQKGSTWVLQATKLNGRIGNITVIPEQINFLNPLLILIFVPIFEGILYPIARKIVMITPLRKMATGGILTAISFIMAGFLQIQADRDAPISIQSNQLSFTYIGESPIHLKQGILIEDELVSTMKALGVSWNRNESDMNGLIMTRIDGRYLYAQFKYAKATSGRSRIIILTPATTNITIRSLEGKIVNQKNVRNGENIDILPTFISHSSFVFEWNCKLNSTCNSQVIDSEMGSIQCIIIKEDSIISRTLISENKISILYMIPQYIIITLGEVLLSVTGLEFAYSQSHPSMKSMMQLLFTALWLMTVFLGNLIDIAISGSHIVKSSANEFFLYAILMIFVMLIFIIFACRYEYVEYSREEKQGTMDDIQLENHNSFR